MEAAARGRWSSALARLRHGLPRRGPTRPRVALDRTLTQLVKSLEGDDAPRVALLVPHEPGPGLAALRRHLPTARIDEFEIGVGVGIRHAMMTAHGPYDLVLDLAPGHEGRKGRFQTCFLHLRPGGRMVIAGAADEVGDPAHRRALGKLLAAGESRRGEDPPTSTKRVPLPVFDEIAISRTVSSVDVHDTHLVLTRAPGLAFAKLREEEGKLVISQRPDLGHRVHEEVPGVHFESRCELTESTPTRGKHQPPAYDAPPAYLRDYRDVAVAPSQIVAGDRMLWPDTFRHNARPRIRNGGALELAPRFASLDFPLDDLPVLDGAYFHLDNEVRGHFGHLLTEQVSRLWAWPQAKERTPDLKLLLGSNNRRGQVTSYEYEIYEAAGVPREDVVLIHEPVRVRRLLSSTPMLSNPDYIHPEIRTTWRRIGDHLAASAVGGPRPKRFFCSRRLTKRACNNTAEVEELFRSAGFEVVFPEDYSLGDQVEMFRGAEVIGGFAGSGLFNICFAEQPLRVITVASQAYNARNEYLISSVLGHRIDAFYSIADRPDFQSSFTFDLDREGRALSSLLSSLG